MHTELQRFLSSEFLCGEIIQTSDVSQTSVVCLQIKYIYSPLRVVAISYTDLNSS